MLHFSYFVWLMIFLVSPLAILWSFFHRVLSRYLHVYVVNLAIVSVGLLWDSWGVHQKIWVFPDGSNVGRHFGFLPLEEYLALILFTVFVTSLTIVVYDFSKIRR